MKDGSVLDKVFDLQRFVVAQTGVFDIASAELEQGEKRSHWMWFVFPQMRGLGRSAMAHRYGISSLAEARAYLAHPVLGPRLVRVAVLLMQIDGKSAREIFGAPDDLKLRSCMTLFARAAPEAGVFGAVIERYFGGEVDRETLALIDESER